MVLILVKSLCFLPPPSTRIELEHDLVCDLITWIIIYLIFTFHAIILHTSFRNKCWKKKKWWKSLAWILHLLTVRNMLEQSCWQEGGNLSTVLRGSFVAGGRDSPKKTNKRCSHLMNATLTFSSFMKVIIYLLLIYWMGLFCDELGISNYDLHNCWANGQRWFERGLYCAIMWESVDGWWVIV